MQLCPCGTKREYMDCCGVFISHQKIPATPEELMRSRYTAYSQNNIEYIGETMKSPAADHFDPEATRERNKKITWVALKVANTSYGFMNGTVEFYASYNKGNKIVVLHEISDFVLDEGRWYYVSGIYPPLPEGGGDKK
jgi:SEC-C motif-containing protein